MADDALTVGAIFTRLSELIRENIVDLAEASA